uniref:Uncharacterized protein n=1 Tax=Daphnia galeata TaxID=27404 RepID=A0A8J2WG96_9CRUS|nr:unnamed protein product [Daphnia galeata]
MVWKSNWLPPNLVRSSAKIQRLKNLLNVNHTATKFDLAQTAQRFNDTHSEVETIKVELKGNSQMLTNVTNVMGTVENLKNIVNDGGLNDQNDVNFGLWTHFVGLLLEEDIF